MATVQQLILYPAMRICGLLSGAQRVAGPSNVTDALAALNAMLDEWATQRLLVYKVVESLFSIVAGQQSYQLGPGAPDWDYRNVPVRIELADFIQIQSQDEPPTYLPLSIMTPQDWFSIGVPTITSSTPQSLYYQRDVPYGTVNLYPVPQIGGQQIALGLWEVLAQFATAGDTVALPPGYLKALQYNLAKELTMRPWNASQLQAASMSQLALEEAKTSLAWVKSMNRPTQDFSMRCESASLGIDARGRWDITTNQYRPY